ncbi:MAG: lysozyme inhibitor LprI family protein [Pseudomonas sp.]|nr:lysozyme inhibitor LprI family protein [Pseudomonas sp.]
MNTLSLFASFAASTLLLAFCGSAYAADNNDSPAYKQCMDASGGVTANMLDCMAADIKLQDARLNKGYKVAMAAIEADKKGQLQNVQRMWIKYRDANCGFVRSLTGGTIDSLNAGSCVLEMTRTRAQELENLVGP